MRFRKIRILLYTLVAISSVVFLPFHLMLVVRDGWILANKSGYQSHDATVTNAEARRGTGRRARKMVEVALNDENPAPSDEPRLVLSRHDFESFPKQGDTVKVWINPASVELSIQGEPVARVGDWYFQRMTVGRVMRHICLLLFLVGAFVSSLRRIDRLLKMNM
jgi:hypothetical protein